MKQIASRKTISINIPLATIARSHMDPSMDVDSPFKAHSNQSSQSHLAYVEYSTIGGIFAQMYALNQAITYPPSLHTSRTIDILMVHDRYCPRLPLKDEGKKRLQGLL